MAVEGQNPRSRGGQTRASRLTAPEGADIVRDGAQRRWAEKRTADASRELPRVRTQARETETA